MRNTCATFAFLLLFPLMLNAHPLGDPPGTLYDIGGRHLHLNCQGQGQPTVLIDIGLGAASLEWNTVMQQIAPRQRVCVFERAGYGWSELGPFPRTSSGQANDLFLLQLVAELKPPYVLIGHSYGGYDMQLFARRYPYLVAGLVLVEASHPQQVERFEAPPFNTRIAPSSPYGIVQFHEPTEAPAGMSAEAVALRDFQYQNWRARRTISWELLGFRDSERELASEPPLPALPMVVLSRGRRAWPAGAHGDLLEGLWRNLQTELAALSPWSAHLVALDSGHQIHLDQPGAVSHAVTLVIDAWRQHGGELPPPPSAVHSEPETVVTGPLEVLSDTLGLPAPATQVSLQTSVRTPAR